jgi:hypothetical protein
LWAQADALPYKLTKCRLARRALEGDRVQVGGFLGGNPLTTDRRSLGFLRGLLHIAPLRAASRMNFLVISFQSASRKNTQYHEASRKILITFH